MCRSFLRFPSMNFTGKFIFTTRNLIADATLRYEDTQIHLGLFIIQYILAKVPQIPSMNLPRKFIITSEKFDYWYNFEQIQHQNSLGYFIIHYMSKKFLTFPSKQTSSFQEEIWLPWNIEQKQQQNSLGGFTIHFISKSSSFQKEKLIKKHMSPERDFQCKWGIT